MQRFNNRVAVIGAGPSGLATARYLKAHSFDPVLFELSESVGGAWNPDSPHCRVWRGMRPTESRVLMRFSDTDHLPETGMFPEPGEMLAYLRRYTDQFGLSDAIRFGTRVDAVARHPAGGWAVHSRRSGATPRTELFARVVICADDCATPRIPKIAGLDRFSGSGGVRHCSDYDGPSPFNGSKVLVVGGSEKAIQIATELAANGAAKVVIASRTPRYVLPATMQSAPFADAFFTRAAALTAVSLPHAVDRPALEETLVQTRQYLVDPASPPLNQDTRAARLAFSDQYGSEMEAGRIETRPEIAGTAGRTIAFGDGSHSTVDAIILVTGSAPDLPRFDLRTCETLGLSAREDSIELADFTLHPALAGLAFTGLFQSSVLSFPSIELQARWIVYSWAGLCPGSARNVEPVSLRSASSNGQPMADVIAILRFARAAGVEPKLSDDPGVSRALLFGPLSALTFRLFGPDALPGAAWEVMTEASRFGRIETPVFTQEEGRLLRALVASGSYPDLAGLTPVTDPEKSKETNRKAA